MTIGERIKESRKKSNKTQKQLADRIGVAEITIRQYESNKREPRFETLREIAAALNVTAGYLLGWDSAVDARKESKITIDDLAFEFGIPTERLKAWEAGTEPVPEDFTEKYRKVIEMMSNADNYPHSQDVIIDTDITPEALEALQRRFEEAASMAGDAIKNMSASLNELAKTMADLAKVSPEDVNAVNRMAKALLDERRANPRHKKQ